MRKLKLWNGHINTREYKRHHLYVAAYSQKHACELIGTIFYGEENKEFFSVNTLKSYFNPDCWGNTMNGIEATEPCVYLHNEQDRTSPPFRVL